MDGRNANTNNDGGPLRSCEVAWIEACAVEGADPHIERFASFDSYLDNQDALEVIKVTPQMIAVAIEQLPV